MQRIMGNILLKILIAEYIVIAIAYFVSGNFAKGIYFVGAVVLSVGVLLS